METTLSRISDPAHLLRLFKTAVAVGVLAGLVTGAYHFAVTEIAIDRAIVLEEAAAAASGEAVEPLPYTREQQKGGLFLAAVMLAVACAMVFGLVYSAVRPLLARWSTVATSVALSAIVLVAVFLLPFLKYPANPPTVGDPETIDFRAAIFLGFQLSTILAAVLAFLLWSRLRGRLGALRSGLAGVALFAAVAGAAFVLIPPNPDPVAAPPDLVASFRAFSALGLAVLWVSIGLFFGLLWRRVESRRAAPA